MFGDKWVIEKRVDGKLDLSAPQPEEFFGPGAITGLTDDAIAKVVYRHLDAAGRTSVVLDGRNIPHWPVHVHPDFWARRKTW